MTTNCNTCDSTMQEVFASNLTGTYIYHCIGCGTLLKIKPDATEWVAPEGCKIFTVFGEYGDESDTDFYSKEEAQKYRDYINNIRNTNDDRQVYDSGFPLGFTVRKKFEPAPYFICNFIGDLENLDDSSNEFFIEESWDITKEDFGILEDDYVNASILVTYAPFPEMVEEAKREIKKLIAESKSTNLG